MSSSIKAMISLTSARGCLAWAEQDPALFWAFLPSRAAHNYLHWSSVSLCWYTCMNRWYVGLMVCFVKIQSVEQQIQCTLIFSLSTSPLAHIMWLDWKSFQGQDQSLRSMPVMSGKFARPLNVSLLCIHLSYCLIFKWTTIIFRWLITRKTYQVEL